MRVFKFCIHSLLLFLAWDHPADIHSACVLTSDGQHPVMSMHTQFIFAAYTCWIGCELGTSLLNKTFRIDMVLHHVFTIIAVLNAWRHGMECIGYSVVRATLLCEPLVDLYFMFKNVSFMHHITDGLFVCGFLYTRLIVLANSCVIPLLFQTKMVVKGGFEFIGVGCVALLYFMQWMWAAKIFVKLVQKLYQ